MSGRVGVLGAARERRAHAWGERGVGKGLRGGTTRGHGQGGCVGGHSADPQADTPGWPPGKVARPFLQARWQRQSSAGSRGWRGSGEATTSEPPGGGGGGVCGGAPVILGSPPEPRGPPCSLGLPERRAPFGCSIILFLVKNKTRFDFFNGFEQSFDFFFLIYIFWPFFLSPRPRRSRGRLGSPRGPGQGQRGSQGARGSPGPPAPGHQPRAAPAALGSPHRGAAPRPRCPARDLHKSALSLHHPSSRKGA